MRTICVLYEPYTTSEHQFRKGYTPQETNCVLFLITMHKMLCCSEKFTFLTLNQKSYISYRIINTILYSNNGISAY